MKPNNKSNNKTSRIKSPNDSDGVTMTRIMPMKTITASIIKNIDNILF